MYPALAMPTRTKGGFVMPPEHEGFIARAVQDMDRLMVIGWRGQEQHFLDLLKASPRPVQGVVVTSKPESAASLVEHLGLHIRGLSAEALGTGPRRKRLCARRRSTVTDPRLLVGHMPMLLRSGHRVALARPDRGGATSGDG